MRVIVDDLRNFMFVIQDARGAVGRITLAADSFIPVVVGIGGILELDGFKRRVLPGRLIKVSVHADISHEVSLECVVALQNQKRFRQYGDPVKTRSFIATGSAWTAPH